VPDTDTFGSFYAFHMSRLLHLSLSAHPMNIYSPCLQKLFACLLSKALKGNFLINHMVVVEVVSFTGFKSLKGYNQKILRSSYTNYLKMR
ncbi:hypothetical protein A2U01_0045088, partial [Trifolium medium]|nr:hypothetical protein [Trifolium medium]